jgi:outer membrane protein TolC
VPLSLTELVQLTLLQNAATQAARLQADSAGKLLQAEQALYEPIATMRVRRESVDRPRTYEERTSGLTNVGKTSALEMLFSGAAGVRGKLPSGATFELTHDMNRRQSNLLASVNDRENRGVLSLMLRQPLLRNRGRDATEADLRVSELEQQIERQRFVKQLVDIVGEGAGTYWQLVRAHEQAQLRTRALASAAQLRDDTRRRVDGGVAPRVELLEADIAHGTREADHLRAQQLVAEAEARVRNLLNLPGRPGSGQRFRAVQSLPAEAPGAGVVAAPAATVPGVAPAAAPPATAATASATPSAIDTASATLERLLAQWPGYQIARLRAEQEQLRLDHARNQQRPDVSLELGYNQNAFAPSFRRTLESSLSDQHRGWYAALSVEMPIGNTGPRSRGEAQQLKRDAARVLMESEARALGNEWATRTAQRDTSQRELALLRQEVASRDALWQAERSNHALGRVRLRTLLEAEDRLNDARSRLIEAEVRTQLAELSLQALTGDLFTRFSVRLDG